MGREWEEYIQQIPKFTKKRTKEETISFLERLGVYQSTCKIDIVHVAGTNGKGSICRYMTSLLMAENKKVGTFYSPHLVVMNERICIDGRMVDDQQMEEAFKKVKKVAKEMEMEGEHHPSFFEFLLGMGLFLFQRAQVDVIVLETGLGGRLDATNVFPNPKITIISSISMDHMNYLGDTIEKIAAEKGGIIKKNVPLVLNGENERVNQVLEFMARQRKAPVILVKKNITYRVKTQGKDIAFFPASAYYGTTPWLIDNPASYQAMNAMEALEAMRLYTKKKEAPRKWQDAIFKTFHQGRMETILPNVVVDGAHNVGAIEGFLETITAREKKAPRILLFSAVADKDYDTMLEKLAKESDADAFVLTQIKDERKVPLKELYRCLKEKTSRPIYLEEDSQKALSIARGLAKEDGMVYALGSLYLVGQVEERIKG